MTGRFESAWEFDRFGKLAMLGYGPEPRFPARIVGARVSGITRSRPRALSVCEVARAGGQLHGKIVAVRGELVARGLEFRLVPAPGEICTNERNSGLGSEARNAYLLLGFDDRAEDRQPQFTEGARPFAVVVVARGRLRAPAVSAQTDWSGMLAGTVEHVLLPYVEQVPLPRK